MARRRKKRAAPRRTRTRTITKTRRVYVKRRGGGRRRRRGGGGLLGGTIGRVLPSKHEMLDMAGAFAYGHLESKAKADQTHFFHTIAEKSPLPSLGMAGNIALAARILNVFVVRSPYLAHFANGVASVAAYQIGRTGQFFKEAKPVPFAIAGDDDDALAGDLDMGALAADADAHQLEGDFDDDDAMGALDDEIVDNIENGV